MQAQGGARFVAVDQAGIGAEVLEPGRGGGSGGQPREGGGQGGPGHAAERVSRLIAVASRVGNPAERAAVAHRHIHPQSAGRVHLAQRRVGLDRGDAAEQFVHRVQRKAAQQQRAGRKVQSGVVEQVSIHRIGSMV